ncbi:DUF397 domain-containing protein [Streptomyces sp. NPDC091272]|uniref:DUF397 domain-containing protein n=1 Tax=Streptomyces sp. NPDC091272 TaxID=3365981 RepID=UPI003805E176
MSLPSSVWHKSTYSGDFQDACVEACAAADGTEVQVQDSKDRGLGPLTISRAAWSAFLVSPYTEAGAAERYVREEPGEVRPVHGGPLGAAIRACLLELVFSHPGVWGYGRVHARSTRGILCVLPLACPDVRRPSTRTPTA